MADTNTPEYIILKDHFADVIDLLAGNAPVIAQFSNHLFSSGLLPKEVHLNPKSSPLDRATQLINSVSSTIGTHSNPSSVFRGLVTSLEKVGLTDMAKKLQQNLGVKTHIRQLKAAVSQSPTVIQLSSKDEVARNIDSLYDQFSDLVADLRNRFEELISDGKIKLIQVTRLAAERLKRPVKSLQADDIDELFDSLQPHYDFLNCSLLKKLTDKFLDGDKLQLSLSQYIDSLDKLLQSSQLKHIRSAIKERLSFLPAPTTNEHTVLVVFELHDRWEEMTLENFKSILRHYFGSNADLFNHIFFDYGSLIVKILIPTSILQIVIDILIAKRSSMNGIGIFQVAVNGKTILSIDSTNINFGKSLLDSRDDFEATMLLRLGANPYNEDALDIESIETYETVADTHETVSNAITDLSEYDDKSMSTMKHILTSEGTSSDIHLLVMGKPGQGKSTFINSLIELQREIAKEGAGTDMCTKSCHSYVHPELLPGVRVRIIDSPGLQDMNADEQLYIEGIKAHCQDVSLVLYCMKMTNHRLDNDDTLALRRLHQAFGSDFWKRVVIVLTFANKEDCAQRDSRDEADNEPPFSDEEGWARLLRKRFVYRVQLHANDINAFLKQRLQIDDLVVEVVPAGYYKPTFSNPDPMKLPDRENWLHDLIIFTHLQIKMKHNFSLWNLNDKIHLAIIIDNHSEVKKEEEGTKMIDDDAQKIKEALNTLGFCTLCFNSLSSRSINTLLEVLHHIDHSQLVSFAFVFLCKGKTRHLYDFNSEIIDAGKIFGCLQDDQSPFAQVPKIYYFHLAHDQEPKEKLQVLSIPSKNSILLVTSVIQKNSSVVLDTVTNNLKQGASIQKCFERIQKECNRKDDVKVSCMYIDGFTYKFVLPTPYKPFNLRAEKEYYKKQLELYCSMWHPIRSETINVISENKDSLLAIVHNERIAGMATTLGGWMVVSSLVLLPFTFGASSVGLTVAGGVLGATGIGAFIIRKILENKQLKSAQELIHLDQQLSIIINHVAEKYNAAMVKCTRSALSSGGMEGNFEARGAQSIANLGKVGMGIAVAGVESAAEAGAIALHTGACAAGASLIVTVPIDLGFIAYHSYDIHKSSKDKTGKNDTNQVVQWLIKQIEDMLKGTCITIELKQYLIEGGLESTIESADYGCKLIVPARTEEKSTINVRTIFSGPFTLPDGCTIVSAIYDIALPEELPPDFFATIKLEHCVNLNDDVTASKMCFATAAIDLEKKVFEFNCIDGGTFPIGKTYASQKINNSCLICVLYKGSTRDTLIKYAGQCFYVKEYKNCWTMSILFTKHLNAHLKYAQSESIGTIESHSFLFTDRNDDQELSMGLCKFKNPMESNGWKISPFSLIPDKITKAEIDSVELQQDFHKLQSRIIPLIEFSVYVDDESASDELEKYFEIQGTTLNIFVKRKKE